MTSRIGNSILPPTAPPTTTPPSGTPTDPRRDMLKELIASRLVTETADAHSVLKEIVNRGEQVSTQQNTDTKTSVQKQAEPKAPAQKQPDVKSEPKQADPKPPAPKEAPATSKPTTAGLEAPAKGAPAAAKDATSTTPKDRPTPTSETVQRALQNMQRDNGLPVTGRFDDATTQLLRNLGVNNPPAAKAPVVEKKPVDPTQQQQVRQRSAGQESLVRARVESPTRTATSTATATANQPALPKDAPLDRALDPARLLASLFAAGFSGKGAEQTLTSFQASKGLPPTGQLDPKTIEQLVSAGHLSAAATEAHKDNASAASASAAVATGASSDKAKNDASRQQTTTTATKAAEVSVRAFASSPAEAKEMARVESLLANANAVERGVQEGKGDPSASAGHGQVAGTTGGDHGSGGEGGGEGKGDQAGHHSDGPAGEESSVGNANAGDDDHNNQARGDASDANNDDEPKDDDGVLPADHYRIPKVSEQVIAALETIVRINDNALPVHYTWDVTLYRPGIYSDGQPAEAVWHLVVERAHAFDPVWQRAQEAIASRLLYTEPDADPVPLDEILGALRRARVR